MAKETKRDRVTVISCMNYRDVGSAIEWLCEAFGFKPRAVYRDDDGKVVHAELVHGNGMIMVGPFGTSDFSKQHMTMPADAGTRVTQSVYVIIDDVDGHCERAKAAGAEILIGPKDESYGGRGYVARDLERHIWSFGSYDPWKTASE